MTEQACPVCGAESELRFQERVLGRHLVRYFLCPGCGYLHTEEPYWLDEAYRSAIADADTGAVQRNVANAWRMSALLYFASDRNGRFVDVAGGYGLLTRLMRDNGFDFRWQDRYCENLFAKGFDATAELAPCAAMTALEVLEHVRHPLRFLKAGIESFRPGLIVLSTTTFEGDPPARSWRYYAFSSGQHIGFFQRRTLNHLAGQLGMNLVSHGSYHLMSSSALPGPLLLRAALGMSAPALAAYARWRMGSRTNADHDAMMGGG